ncbi:hypothetical protein A2380_01590 [candidate division WWE3 bacterium RIFOXYB1_FULL_43_24]|nr:MAG: hypothetical protein A2380_01590 [candidate division WWE3 bacterium RIFOXYB1_FULL_43_24]OGC73203.1 MAG: hypothetical protein A2414_01515 [candidate division WWE3 bacterium RIFOXYC1_FULL_42_13]
MYWYYNNMHWGGFGWILMLIFWVFVIFVGIEVVRILLRTGKENKNGNTPADRTPMEILKKRYAKGEIDKKEFEEKKKDLM